MDAFKLWQFGKLNKIIYVSRGFYCQIKGALRVAACHALIRPFDLVFESRKKEVKKEGRRRGYNSVGSGHRLSTRGCTREYLIKARETSGFDCNDHIFGLNASACTLAFRGLQRVRVTVCPRKFSVKSCALFKSASVIILMATSVVSFRWGGKKREGSRAT